MQANAILIAIAGLLSAVVGGAIQAWAARVFEREKFGRQARYDAYGSYFRAVGELSFASSAQEQDIAHAKIAESRGRIALYGSPAVVSAMAQAFGVAAIYTRMKLDRLEHVGAATLALRPCRAYITMSL